MHAGLALSLTTVQVVALVFTHLEALAAIPVSLHMDPSHGWPGPPLGPTLSLHTQLRGHLSPLVWLPGSQVAD